MGWLQSFADRVSLSEIPFISTAAISFFLTAVLIYFSTLKAARANPVIALKQE